MWSGRRANCNPICPAVFAVRRRTEFAGVFVIDYHELLTRRRIRQQCNIIVVDCLEQTDEQRRVYRTAAANGLRVKRASKR
jgi:hypothetical protein